MKYKKEDLQPQGSFSLILENAGFEFLALTSNGCGSAPMVHRRSSLALAPPTAVPDFRYIVWVQDGKKDNIRIQIWDGTQLVFDNGSMQRLSGNISVHHVNRPIRYE